MSDKWQVVADRDNGDDPQWEDWQPGDRWTLEVDPNSKQRLSRLVRIERPVPSIADMAPGATFTAKIELLRERVQDALPKGCVGALSPRRIFIRRPSGYLSAYPLSMLFGAAILAPRKYRRPYCPVVLQVGQRHIVVPRPLVYLTAPWNRYQPGTVAPPRMKIEDER